MGSTSAGRPAMGTRLILVRHGETEANVRKVWHGHLDAPLTPRGRLQVEATARRLASMHREHPIHAIYVSPLPRARRTAEAIARAIGRAPTVEPGLREMSIGDWEGLSFQELQQRKRLWERWARDPHFAPPNGESPVAFSRRVRRTMEGLARRHPGQTLVVVTHGGVISNVLAQWFGEGPQDWVRFDAPNCAISVVEWDGEGWHPVRLNDVDHLPRETRTPRPATEIFDDPPSTPPGSSR